MHISLFELLGASFFLVTLLMSILWIFAYVKNNAGIVDIGWGLSFFITILAYFFLGDGFWLKRLLITLLVSVWSLRLTWHLWERFDASKEDPRYTALRSKLGKESEGMKLYLIFLFQAFLVIILSIPFLIISGYSNSSWHSMEGLGLLLWAGGFIGESYADWQMRAFKSNPANKGKVCTRGLWRYSRHPNYFFEWVVWLGYFLLALPSPFGIFALISPVLMLVLLTRVSGIPPMEELALKTKGDAYQEYQKTTSCFVPLPPKK